MTDITAPVWKLNADKLTASFSFDPEVGLTITRLENAAGDRPVNYVHSPRSLLPFPLGEDAYGNRLSPLRNDEARFTLLNAEISDRDWGGRPVNWFTATYTYRAVELTFHAVAFPGVSVLRTWFTVKNLSLLHDASYPVVPLSLNLYNDDHQNVFYVRYLRGGNANYDHGQMLETVLGPGRTLPRVDIQSTAETDYVPLLVVSREESPADGLMLSMDYTGAWSVTASRSLKQNATQRGDAAITFSVSAPASISPMQTQELPGMTFAAFSGSMDNLMKVLYDWQYEYMWDFTNENFAKTRGISYWVYCSRNLHEQFIFRASTSPLFSKVNQRVGAEMFWDDAGWSSVPGWPIDSYGSVFSNNYEGPDFRIAQRFYQKSGIKWLLWFAGEPTSGLLETKAGAWGPFEWRTDGQGPRDIKEDSKYRKTIQNYLLADPLRSFHTCNGGSSGAHDFGVQRLGTYHYLADMGTGPYKTYNFSYFEVPDKYGDITNAFSFGNNISYEGGTGFYPAIDEEATSEERHVLDQAHKDDASGQVCSPEFATGELIHVPHPCHYLSREDQESHRVIAEIYRYLKDNGVAGRWSYMFHPEVRGERNYQVMQRMSHDLLKGVIILRRRPRKPITIYPAGLKEDAVYTVTFRNNAESFSKTGAELMENGIRLLKCTDGELVLLNLPDFPGKVTEVIAPSAPATVVFRREEALGYYGTGIYWSPAHADEKIYRYEIAKNGNLIDEVSVGKYYFDNSAPQDSDTYAVRAVSVSGMRSPWQNAQRLSADETEVYSALGLFGEDMNTSGWRAEFSRDLKVFEPMTFVPPADCPYADLGGTPNQPGGIEGWWVGGKCGKVGHGWMQATSDGWCVRSFVCPHDGDVTITGRAMKEWYHREVTGELKAGVLHNETLVGEWKILRPGDIYGGAWLEKLSVKAGDMLRFVLSPASAENEETCPWEKDANLVGWIPTVRYDKNTNEQRVFVSAEGGQGRIIRHELKVPDGLYCLKLRMEENEYRYSGERVMRLCINGELIEKELDIRHDSRGRNVLEKTYRYLVPEDGVITLELEAVGSADAILTSAELCSEQYNPIRINCGGEDFIDWAGNVWCADRYFCGGDAIYAPCDDLMQASPTLYDRKLYSTARSADSIRYEIPVQDGFYSVQLKFAELWQQIPGDRRVDVLVCGKKSRSRWDALESAGLPCMTADMRIDDVRPVNGCITVEVISRGELPAILQAIEIE